MSSGDFDNWDLCPVCQEMYVEPHKYYCSELCRKVARKFRRRFDRIVQELRQANFECTWKQGVHLEIKCPEYIAFAYPNWCATIEFGGYGEIHFEEGTSDLWKRIEERLGAAVKTVIEAQLRYQNSDYLFKQDYVHDRLVAFLQDDKFSFECTHCHERYITSDCTYDVLGKLCQDCAVESIPF